MLVVVFYTEFSLEVICRAIARFKIYEGRGHLPSLTDARYSSGPKFPFPDTGYGPDLLLCAFVQLCTRSH